MSVQGGAVNVALMHIHSEENTPEYRLTLYRQTDVTSMVHCFSNSIG